MFFNKTDKVVFFDNFFPQRLPLVYFFWVFDGARCGIFRGGVFIFAYISNMAEQSHCLKIFISGKTNINDLARNDPRAHVADCISNMTLLGPKIERDTPPPWKMFAFSQFCCQPFFEVFLPKPTFHMHNFRRYLGGEIKAVCFCVGENHKYIGKKLIVKSCIHSEIKTHMENLILPPEIVAFPFM